MSDDHDVPPYPKHLTEDERSAVFAVTADKLETEFFRPEGKELPVDVLAPLLATMCAIGFLRTTWQGDRIKQLEQRCAELEMALAKRETTPSGKKLDALSARIVELEAGGIHYCGVYQRSGVTYRKGSLVTADGSGWIALREAKEGEAPGASSAWQLAIKRGKDGRDAR